MFISMYLKKYCLLSNRHHPAVWKADVVSNFHPPYYNLAFYLLCCLQELWKKVYCTPVASHTEVLPISNESTKDWGRADRTDPKFATMCFALLSATIHISGSGLNPNQGKGILTHF